MEEAHSRLPGIGIGHILDELVVLQKPGQCLQARNLEAECGRFEAVWPRGVRGHGVGQHVTVKK